MDSQQEATTDSPFFSLPIELRDEIYKLAYVEQEVFKIAPVRDLVEKEARRRRRANIYRGTSSHHATAAAVPIGECPLLQMRVSQQWYSEASLRWVQSVKFENDDPRQLREVCASSRALANLTCLCTGWSYEFSFESHHDLRRLLKSSRQLRLLRLRVSDEAFRVIKDRLACCHTFDEKDFCSMQGFQTITGLGSLQRVQLVAWESELVENDEEQAKWQANVGALETLMNTELQRKRQEAQQLNSQTIKKQEAQQQTSYPVAKTTLEDLVDSSAQLNATLLGMSTGAQLDTFPRIGGHNQTHSQRLQTSERGSFPKHPGKLGRGQGLQPAEQCFSSGSVRRGNAPKCEDAVAATKPDATVSVSAKQQLGRLEAQVTGFQKQIDALKRQIGSEAATSTSTSFSGWFTRLFGRRAS